MDCSPPGSSVQGIFQARTLEWVAISFSRGSSQPRDWTWVSCTAGRFFIDWATREALSSEPKVPPIPWSAPEQHWLLKLEWETEPNQNGNTPQLHLSMENKQQNSIIFKTWNGSESCSVWSRLWLLIWGTHTPLVKKRDRYKPLRNKTVVVYH